MASGCRSKHGGTSHAASVVLYTSVDDPFVRPLIERFQNETGITVTLVTDAEASKTTGLAEKLLAEKDHPRADVYWGNEPFHTINLAEAGALTAYRSPAAADIPDRWRDRADMYSPIGLRARMIAISTRPENRELVAKIRGLSDLAHPELKGKIGMSNPGFGTASGHVAALYLLWGDDGTNTFLRALRSNGILLLGGNSVVADQVASGNLVAGLTDNDDIANAKAMGQPIDAVVPDQDGDGTLLIPTTIALVRNAPNSEGGRKLIDFLLTPAVEKRLVEAHFLAYAVRGQNSQVKSMKVDYVKVAHRVRDSVRTSLEVLQDRESGVGSKGK
jgi:iron(III) transport system substrate-binding protein